jgi:hypothetical protein
MIVRRLPRFVLLGLIFSVLGLPGLALASQLATPQTLTASLSVRSAPAQIIRYTNIPTAP